MNTTAVRNYAPQARLDFIQAVTDRAAHFGLTAAKTEPVIERGDVALIGGRAFPLVVARQRKALEERVRENGFDATMEALAYTWFNRLVAIRFMELRVYLENGEGGACYRVLSHPEGKATPEILDKAEHVELPRLDKDRVIQLKLDGKETELYRLLLIAQCNALHEAMPFLFEKIEDETELVLPESLLHTDSLVRKLVAGIEEADWQEVEILGWIYEAYIADRYAAVIGKVVAGADIPAATQRFTPKWVVRYLVQNTLGRTWLASYPASGIKAQMPYYIEPAEQTGEVQEQLRALTPATLNPEEITLLDPACGSAHILVEAYDLFKAIYRDRGYPAHKIPALIIGKNLFGLEIDDRAAQLAAFALLMKARADDPRIFTRGVQPHVIALQETRGWNAPDIADALGVEEAGVIGLVTLFENAKTFGSLIQVLPKVLEKLTEVEARTRLVAEKSGDLFGQGAARKLMPIIEQAKLLAGRYECVVANPPYMGAKFYNASLKEFVNKHYKNAKADLYACFIQRNCCLGKPNGFVGMITIPNWMFLSSFEDMRTPLFANQTIDTFVHNGRGVFGSDFGSCSFVFRNHSLPKYRGVFRRLFDKQGSVTPNEELDRRFFQAAGYTPSNAFFQAIPGHPVAYWVSNRIQATFQFKLLLGEVLQPKVGLQTGDNEQFLRRWHEVSLNNICFSSSDRATALQSGRRWFPYHKGGEWRKWYGNHEFVVDWENDGRAIRDNCDDGGRQRSRPQNVDYYFREGITWGDITTVAFAARLSPQGFIFDVKGSSGFPPTHLRPFVLGLLCSALLQKYMLILNPSATFQVGDIARIPLVTASGGLVDLVSDLVSRAVEIARSDWDSSESSWDFQTLPVLQHRAVTLQQSQETAEAECRARLTRLKQLEEENNRLFIDGYGLQDELSPEVPDDQITLCRPDRAEDVQRLLSYIVGCMMGRYSLDRPGLIYAHGGNAAFDTTQYKTFPADDDAIVPLLEKDWGFTDDAVTRVAEFVSKVWPVGSLEANLRFLADSLEPKAGELPRETIRRYLATAFFKDHLKTYKKRPIYWLFNSGKERAFQALVYLHRYQEGTLARMRTEYVIPLQSRIAARIESLDSDIPKATKGDTRRKLQKEQDGLKRQQTELLRFDEKLSHVANQRITLDLDDGVKVNYGTFGDLLANVKDVCGTKEDD